MFGTILYSSCVDKNINDRLGNEKYEEFVFIDGNTFAVGDSAFFPIMVNYKVEPIKIGNEVVISPARYYENTTKYEAYTKSQVLDQIKGHMQLMKEMGFNSIRVCMDVLSRNEHGYYYHSQTQAYLKADESLILNAIDDFLDIANEKGLKVMLLIKPPFEDELKNFAMLTVAGIINAFGVTIFLSPVKLFDSGILMAAGLGLVKLFGGGWEKSVAKKMLWI